MVYSQKTGATFPLEMAGIASAAGGYGARPNAGQYDINPYGGATAMHPSMVNIIVFYIYPKCGLIFWVGRANSGLDGRKNTSCTLWTDT